MWLFRSVYRTKFWGVLWADVYKFEEKIHISFIWRWGYSNGQPSLAQNYNIWALSENLTHKESLLFKGYPHMCIVFIHLMGMKCGTRPFSVEISYTQVCVCVCVCRGIVHFHRRIVVSSTPDSTPLMQYKEMQPGRRIPFYPGTKFALFLPCFVFERGTIDLSHVAKKRSISNIHSYK